MAKKDETVFGGNNRITKTKTKFFDKLTDKIIDKAVNTNWMKVSMGGTSGILMGTAASYAFSGDSQHDGKPSGNTTTDNQTNQTDMNDSVVSIGNITGCKVSDKLSFKDAFNEAREQVGSGGVFEWRGKLFNTFTSDEWEKMSDAEKRQFSDGVKHFIQPAETEEDTLDLTEAQGVSVVDPESTEEQAFEADDIAGIEIEPVVEIISEPDDILTPEIVPEQDITDDTVVNEITDIEPEITLEPEPLPEPEITTAQSEMIETIEHDADLSYAQNTIGNSMPDYMSNVESPEGL